MQTIVVVDNQIHNGLTGLSHTSILVYIYQPISIIVCYFKKTINK